MKATYLGHVTLKIVTDEPIPHVIEKLDRVTVRSNGMVEWSAVGPDKVMIGSGKSIHAHAGDDTIEVTITIKRK